MAETLYKSIFNSVIERIVSGEYAPAAMLPSEFELADEFGVSQGTARKALIELEQKGIVERRQGKGTFVTQRTPENSLFHFFRLRDETDRQVKPQLHSEKVIRRKATAFEKSTLYGEPDEVFEIERVRNFLKEPLCHETSVVSVALFPGLLERAPLPNTLYVLFQQAFGCAIISAVDDLVADSLSVKHSKALGMKAGLPVLVTKRKAYDMLERVVELRRSIYVTNKIHYSVLLE